MIAIVGFLGSITASILVVRVAAVALSMTGISYDVAYLQALSAFTGTGFTTSESELVLEHPVRRRIIQHAIIIGNAGLAAVLVSALTGAFQAVADDAVVERLGLAILGLACLAAASRSRLARALLTRIIRWMLGRWTELDLQDYHSLLALADGFSVAEIVARPEDWITGRTLEELALDEEGVRVLGIHRQRGYEAVPSSASRIDAGDRLVLYGPRDAIRDLERRPRNARGDRAHEQWVHAEERRAALAPLDEGVPSSHDALE